MATVLHFISSPRGDQSLTRKLGNIIIDKIKAGDPNATAKEHVLSENPYPHLEEVHMAGFFTPEEYRTPEQTEALKNSDNAIAELQEADVIVIGVPMYNFQLLFFVLKAQPFLV
jgi:FMN-dependent NADH-azoreductase